MSKIFQYENKWPRYNIYISKIRCENDEMWQWATWSILHLADTIQCYLLSTYNKNRFSVHF